MSEEYPPVGHPLQKLAARLTELLDEDYWADCEVLLLEAWNARPDSKPYKFDKYNEALKDDKYIGCFPGAFEAGFKAARERKEG